MPLISNRKVNPSGPIDASILIIGEAPGYEEDKDGKPFIGPAGEQLDTLLGSVGLSRASCRITNICNYKPADNNFDYLKDSKELKEGLGEIFKYLKEHKPKIVLLLGETPINYILGKYKITKWRGSVIQKDGHTFLCTYHPAYLTRNRNEYPIAAFDFQRLRSILDNGYRPPTHNFIIDPRGTALYEAMAEIKESKAVAIDVETPRANPHQLLCAGFAVSAEKSFCIVNHSFFGMSAEFQTVMYKLLDEAPAEQEHIYHNGYSFDIPVFKRNGFSPKLSYDTILAAHCLQPEFRRTLAFLTSLYTLESYYKWMVKETEDEDQKGWSDKIPKEVLREYNCIDTICTYQSWQGQLEDFKDEPECWETYLYEMELVPANEHINSAGLPIDLSRREFILNHVNHELAKRLQLINIIAGRNVNPNGRIVLQDVLFNQFKLPVRKNREGKVTTDEDAIVSLISTAKLKVQEAKLPATKFEHEKKVAFLKLILQARGLDKLKSNYLEYELNSDNRARGTYKIPGTDTGRWSCSKAMDNTGLNMQTFPRLVMEIEETNGKPDK